MTALFEIYSEDEVISVLRTLSNSIITDIICTIHSDLAKLDYIKITRLHGTTVRMCVTDGGRNFYNEIINS